MSEIKVGDLVIVVRPGCNDWNLGKIYKVLDVVPGPFQCGVCDAIHGDGRWAMIGERSAIAFSRLRKIDPPAVPESTENKEELTA